MSDWPRREEMVVGACKEPLSLLGISECSPGSTPQIPGPILNPTTTVVGHTEDEQGR